MTDSGPTDIDGLVDHLQELRGTLLKIEFECTVATIRLWWLAHQSGSPLPEDLYSTVQRNSDRSESIVKWETHLTGNEYVPRPPLRDLFEGKRGGSIIRTDE